MKYSSVNLFLLLTAKVDLHPLTGLHQILQMQMKMQMQSHIPKNVRRYGYKKTGCTYVLQKHGKLQSSNNAHKQLLYKSKQYTYLLFYGSNRSNKREQWHQYRPNTGN